MIEALSEPVQFTYFHSMCLGVTTGALLGVLIAKVGILIFDFCKKEKNND